MNAWPALAGPLGKRRRAFPILKRGANKGSGRVWPSHAFVDEQRPQLASVAHANPAGKFDRDTGGNPVRSASTGVSSGEPRCIGHAAMRLALVGKSERG